MEYGFTTAAYVVASVLFILSLGGLSGQESAKRAIWYGIVGMGLAVLATLFGPGLGNWWLTILMIAVGGVETAADVRERLAAGAALVQGYTWFIYRGPGWAREVNRGLVAG